MFTRWGYRRGRAFWTPTSRFLDQQHIVITGANSGLGLATALELARAGAELTLVIRNPENEGSLRSLLQQVTEEDKVTIEIADLSLMGEVHLLTERLLARGKKNRCAHQ
jgi:NAD(P)-dependent dehydrogenase (short-subunit alcohol dehydrogenase family)